MIKGKIVEILNQKDNDWGRYRIKTDTGEIMAVGIIPKAVSGINISLEGKEENTKYGKQYTISHVIYVEQDKMAGVRMFLSNGYVKGIGKATAEKLAEQYGSGIFDILEDEISIKQLVMVNGITENKLKSIHESYIENKKYRDIVIVLNGNVTKKQAEKIYEKYGEKAAKKIKENPANDKLRTGKRLLDIEKENTKNDSEEVKQENIPIKDNEEKTLKANIKQKRRNRIEYFDLHPEIPLDDKKIQKLKDIFWEMNTISYRVESVEKDIEVIDDSGNTHTEKAIRKVLYIDIQGKSVEEMSNIYNFSENQLQQIAELRSDKYKDLWSNVLYGSSGGNTNIVEVASSQLGNVGGQPYWSWYGFNSRVSWCVCFVSWCANECGYIDIGIIPKFANCQNEGIVWFKTCGLWQDNGYIPKSRRNNIF